MPKVRRTLFAVLLLFPHMAFACGAVAGATPRIIRASTAEGGLTITFLGHASFLIQTPERIRAVTDYDGRRIPGGSPDIVTMNHAHSTHYTDHPDPRIPNVLRGWAQEGKPADVDLTVGDLRVRNVPTNIRDWGGSGTEYYGNSIFIFESSGLCVAHLGHLHHLLTPDDLAAIGEIDVLMTPVDGMYTMSHQDMAKVVDQLHPGLVLPMHYFTTDILDGFLDLMRDHYTIVMNPGHTTTISRATLPAVPTILVLPGSYY